MKGEQILIAFLLGVGLCFVSVLAYGGQDEYMSYGAGVSLINSFLLEARVNYVMRNPTDFLNVQMYYDSDGKYSRGLPESVDTEGKLFVWVVDNRDVFSDKSEIALLNIFKRSLKEIYSCMVLAVVATDMDTDIVAVFISRELTPLGYFYQGEYHLWEKTGE